MTVKFQTREQADGSHIVVKGRIGRYGPGDSIPTHVVMQMRAGMSVDMGNGYTLAKRGAA